MRCLNWFQSLLVVLSLQVFLLGDVASAQTPSGEYFSMDGRKLELLPNKRWAIGNVGGKYEIQGDNIFLEGGAVGLRGKIRERGALADICFEKNTCYANRLFFFQKIVAEGVLSTSAYKVAIAEEYEYEKRVPQGFDKKMAPSNTKWFSTRVTPANDIVVQFGREYSGGKLVTSPAFAADGRVSWKCKAYGIPKGVEMSTCSR